MSEKKMFIRLTEISRDYNEKGNTTIKLFVRPEDINGLRVDGTRTYARIRGNEIEIDESAIEVEKTLLAMLDEQRSRSRY